jgi:hypothetical protein
MSLNDTIQAEIRAVTTFLRHRYGCTVASERSSAYGYRVTMHGQVAGANVGVSLPDGPGLIVEVGKLINGDLPARPTVITASTTFERFFLETIAKAQIETLPTDLVRVIESQAQLTGENCIRLIEACCTPIFAGDFSIFARASELNRNFAREHRMIEWIEGEKLAQGAVG